MEDFSALAARIAVGVGELRGCLILSRDGLELGSFPPDAEDLVKPAWIRFAQLGDPEKGFVEFGDDLWVYVRRGPYAVFAVAGASVRPGLIMDQLEQLLLAAEEARARRDALKIPEVPDAPKSRPRTSLHRDARQQSSGQPPGGRSEPAPAPVGSTAAAAPMAPRPGDEPAGTPVGVGADGQVPDDGDLEVDRVLLAQEFSKLLQEGRFDDEEEATGAGEGR